jgi:hypothetical protein
MVIRRKEDTMSDQSVKKRPDPLPARLEDWKRNIKIDRTLNDYVEDVHRALLVNDEDGERYRSLLDAVYDEDAVEGSLSIDNALAAQMIRTYAMDQNTKHFLANKKIATISKSLNVVMRRYNASRSERRNMVGGVVVPGNASIPGNNGD